MLTSFITRVEKDDASSNTNIYNDYVQIMLNIHVA